MGGLKLIVLGMYKRDGGDGGNDNEDKGTMKARVDRMKSTGDKM